MLKIPKKIEYAFLALKYIAENSDLECISTKVISQNAAIPHELTAKILQKLVKSEIIKSSQGVKGGYILNIPPEEINLGMVIKAVDEEILITNCMFDGAAKTDCDRLENCCLRNPLQRIQLRINDLFHTTYLREIIN